MHTKTFIFITCILIFTASLTSVYTSQAASRGRHRNPPQTRLLQSNVNGTVTEFTANSITLQPVDSALGSSLTVYTTATTTFARNNKKTLAPSLIKDVSIAVTGVFNDSKTVLTASAINVLGSKNTTATLGGTIAALGTSTVSVIDYTDASTTVITGKTSIVDKANTRGDFASLKVGDKVTVLGKNPKNKPTIIRARLLRVTSRTF